MSIQPLGRPAVRSLLRRGAGLPPRPAFRPDMQQPICLRCETRALQTTPIRFFSAPKEPSKDPAPKKIQDIPSVTELAAPDLPSAQSDNQGSVKERFSQLMDRLQNRALDASHTLNDLTGYSLIEAIKIENSTLEKSLAEAHARLRAARQSYKSSNAKRAATQREVTTLLARKESWSPSDLERFTELYRTDHVLEGEVSTAQELLTEAEADEQTLSQRLNSGILKRYHEEQIWSDKIRRASTWGTWGLMGMNFLLFVVLQFFAEPWRRRRLVQGVVAEEKEVLDEVRGELAAVKLALEGGKESVQDGHVVVPASGLSDTPTPTVGVAPTETAEAGHVPPAVSWREFVTEPARWRPAMEDLYSERKLHLRMRDVSVVALEGAAVGAALAASIAWAVVRRT